MDYFALAKVSMATSAIELTITSTVPIPKTFTKANFEKALL